MCWEESSQLRNDKKYEYRGPASGKEENCIVVLLVKEFCKRILRVELESSTTHQEIFLQKLSAGIGKTDNFRQKSLVQQLIGKLLSRGKTNQHSSVNSYKKSKFSLEKFSTNFFQYALYRRPRAAYRSIQRNHINQRASYRKTRYTMGSS